MRHPIKPLLFLILAPCFFVFDSLAEVNVAIMLNSEKEAEAYQKIVDAYHLQQPDTNVSLHYFSDIRYKQSISQWLQHKEYDLLYWQAGRQRLFNFAQQGLLADLNDLWNTSKIGESLAANLEPLVKFNDEIIAIPYSYYHWGLFYNKALFSRLKIDPPSTYKELLKSCRVLWKNDVIPVGMGLSEQWPVLAWYSYFAIRMFGIDYYHQMVDGEISWLDERNYKIMKNWGRVLSACTTNSDAREVNWRIPARSLMREDIGMVLSGNFVNQLFDEAQQAKLGYFPFPQLDEDIPQFESGPVEVWIMPKGGSNASQAKEFVKFFMQADNLNRFNHAISYLSPNRNGNPNLRGISLQGVDVLKNADGLIQYIDRDAHAEFVTVMEKELTDYINHRNIDIVLLQLETARTKHYSKQ